MDLILKSNGFDFEIQWIWVGVARLWRRDWCGVGGGFGREGWGV